VNQRVKVRSFNAGKLVLGLRSPYRNCTNGECMDDFVTHTVGTDLLKLAELANFKQKVNK